jgi:hypothetical protein
MKRYTILISLFFILLICACTLSKIKRPEVFVDVYCSLYSPKFNNNNYADYKGKKIIFDSIRMEAKNATMLGYYSTDKYVRYTVNYDLGKMPPPIESFLWYALQKSFTNAGITATNENIEGALELYLNFTSFNDQEAKFQMQLLKGNKLLIKKDMTVAQMMPLITDTTELEKRSYNFYDAITVAILDDPDFKREMTMSQSK